jgi:hypothetical protein
VQVTFTPKGVLKASVYLEWPAQVFREASEVQDEAVEPVLQEHVENAPAAPPRAQPEAKAVDAAPVEPTGKAGVKFTVTDPAKTKPTKAKPKPDRKSVVAQGVDKNALSARGGAPKAGHKPTEGPTSGGECAPGPPAAAAPSWAVVVGKKHGKKATVPRQIVAEPEPPPVGGSELKRERERKAGALSLFRASAERSSSDESEGSPPFKSPRGSGAESMAEDEVYSDRYSGYGSDY